MRSTLTQWVEIDPAAYCSNLKVFRKILGGRSRLMAVVKADAYGHGLDLVAPLAARGGADVLGVNNLEEGLRVRELGLDLPVVVLGYIPLARLGDAFEAGLEPVLYNAASLIRLHEAAKGAGRKAPFHLKLETGVNRQGVMEEDLQDILLLIRNLDGLSMAGVSMHFANIEDTTDHAFARFQLVNFNRMIGRVESVLGRRPPVHAACSAAAILLKETHFDMARVGISSYGLWPSKETYLSTILLHQDPPRLEPVLSWKTRIAQIKRIPADSHVGYGCSFRATHPIRMAVLPVGYYDGYDRRLSGQAQVLVKGKRAPVLGRVCMNMLMADVTDIPDAAVEDEAVLIGAQGKERITADELAAACHTINYEIVARIGAHVPRVVRDA
ncbi:MAG: alanine racemase [Acidobacteria bacterium]|nr:alanine racemase [Acidobacteriota bacterium]